MMLSFSELVTPHALIGMSALLNHGEIFDLKFVISAADMFPQNCSEIVVCASLGHIAKYQCRSSDR